MSVDNVKGEKVTKQDISWETAILDAKAQIVGHQSSIAKLQKAIKFFEKQKSESVPFLQGKSA